MKKEFYILNATVKYIDSLFRGYKNFVFSNPLQRPSDTYIFSFGQIINMVLESMINPKNAEDKPLHIFIISVIYTLIAIFFANLMFPLQTSMLSVAIVTIIFVPFFQKLFAAEEEKEDLAAKRYTGENFIARHLGVITVFSAFFLGVVIATSLAFIFYPGENLFPLQTETVKALGSGAFAQEGNFYRFLFNNTQVMFLTFTLSILFGAGAVLILAWNASVIAVYLGLIAKSFVAQGFSTTAAYLFGIPAGFSSIAFHGIPEILAYFAAGLGGGILSVGIVREKIQSRNFRIIFLDSAKFLMLAELLIIAAAYIEAF